MFTKRPFYGAPWVPALEGQAFYRTDSELRDKWSTNPDDTDVLITHTPPAGILNLSGKGLSLGCKELPNRIDSIAPIVHCFGHVHASSGMLESGGTTLVNAAMAGRQYNLVQQPYEIDI